MAKKRDYYIAFDTQNAPGLIQATRVSMGVETIRDLKRSFNIALVDDPLYPTLVRYVLANLPPEALARIKSDE